MIVIIIVIIITIEIIYIYIIKNIYIYIYYTKHIHKNTCPHTTNMHLNLCNQKKHTVFTTNNWVIEPAWGFHGTRAETCIAPAKMGTTPRPGLRGDHRTSAVHP